MLTSAFFDALAMSYWRLKGKQQGDVFLCSYPKSGRTWLRFLITNYQLRLIESDFNLTLNNLPLLSPNLTLFTKVKMRKLPPEFPITRLLGTHSEIPALFRATPVIMLKRNPCDTLISYYHHLRARDECPSDIEAFIWSWQGLPRLIRYYNRWEQDRKRSNPAQRLQLSYEQLSYNTQSSIEDCLRFMHIKLDSTLLDEAIEFASSRNMRKLESRWGNPNFSASQLKSNTMGYKVRKAEVGGFRNVLSESTVLEIENRLERELINFKGLDDEY